MKALLLLLLAPLGVSAQTDTTFQLSARADTLKPIEIREYPYTYTTHSYRTYRGHRYSTSNTHTGLKRIYTYDGIDVDKPGQTLRPTILAVDDPDANQEMEALQVSLQKQRTAAAVGWTLAVPGFIMLIVGGVQANEYKKALAEKVKNYNATPYYTTPAPMPVYASCSIFLSTTDPKTGTPTYTCATDSRIVTTNPGALGYPIPGAYTTPSPVYIPHSNPPTTVDLPNGRALGITGLGLMLTGLIVAATGNDRIDHLHRAVQYYNRALSRKISWRLEPYSGFGQSGLTLRGRF